MFSDYVLGIVEAEIDCSEVVEFALPHGIVIDEETGVIYLAFPNRIWAVNPNGMPSLPPHSPT